MAQPRSMPENETSSKSTVPLTMRTPAFSASCCESLAPAAMERRSNRVVVSRVSNGCLAEGAARMTTSARSDAPPRKATDLSVRTAAVYSPGLMKTTSPSEHRPSPPRWSRIRRAVQGYHERAIGRWTCSSDCPGATTSRASSVNAVSTATKPMETIIVGGRRSAKPSRVSHQTRVSHLRRAESWPCGPG